MPRLTRFAARWMRRLRPRTGVDRGDCSLRDLAAGGWFNTETGEVFTGFPVGPSDTYLDVGCGTGGAALFAARQGSRVIATDVNRDRIAALEPQLRALATAGHRCLVSDSDPLPLPDGIATRITCAEVLEHVPNPPRFIAELVRVGAPDALYLLTVPDPASEAVQRDLAADCYWREPNHVRIFGRDEFAALVSDAGLRIEARHFVGFYASVWWALFWSAGQELGDREQPLLAAWTTAWARVLAHPEGCRIKRALDRCLPKSQIIVARKAARPAAGPPTGRLPEPTGDPGRCDEAVTAACR